MKKLLRPAVLLMDSLGFAKKFLLIGLVCFIPLLAAAFVLVYQANTEIVFLEKEQQGIRYNHSIRTLVEQLQQFRGMNNARLNGDASFQGKVQEKSQEVNASFDRLDEELKRGKVPDDIYALFNDSKNQWQQINKNEAVKSADNVFLQANSVIKNMLNLNNNLNAIMNLKMDKDIGTNNFHSILNDSLLPSIEELGQARGKGAGILARKSITEEEKLNMAVLRENVKSHVEEINGRIAIIGKTNNAISSELLSDGNKVAEQIARVNQLVYESILAGQPSTVKPAEYFSEMTKAITISYEFYDKGIMITEALLQERLEKEQLFRNEVILVLALILAGLIYIFLSFKSSVSSNIQVIASMTKQVAAGNLCVNASISSKDEIGSISQSFNKMTGSLCSLVGAIQTNVTDLASTSEELNASAAQSAQAAEHIAINISGIAQRSQEQAQMIIENEKVVFGITKKLEKISEKTSEIVNTAQISMNTAEAGSNVAKDAIERMSHIQAAVRDSMQRVNNLDQESNKISQIIEAISEIAGQTNLLALNAAIEAARAGEAGRGFAVVADEVRKLAEQSRQSAQQINEIIQDIQRDTKAVVDSMQVGNSEVEDGVKIVQLAVNSFADIMNDFERVTKSVNEIANPVEEIARESQAVFQTVKQSELLGVEIAEQADSIASAAEEQSAAMEEIVSASKNLAQQADKSKTLSEEFII